MGWRIDELVHGVVVSYDEDGEIDGVAEADRQV